MFHRPATLSSTAALLVLIAGCGEDPITPPPPPVDEVTSLQLAVGGNHACVLDGDGQAWCWGANWSGQLGIGHEGDTVPVPTQVQQSGLRFAALEANNASTCGIEESGRVYCWGSNLSGQLGIGVDDRGPFPTPVPVDADLEFESLSLGLTAACGLATDEAVYCWGSNDYGGNLGQPTTVSTLLSPTEVAGTRGLDLVDVSTGFAVSCARSVDGALYCWGMRSYFGNGEATGRATEPVLAAGGRTFDQAMAGAFAVCGVSGGTGYCWGDNFYGQLGTGRSDYESVPAPLAGSRSYRFVSREPVNSVLRGGCGITTDERVTCWGSNDDLELGAQTAEQCTFNDTMGPCSTVPVSVELDARVVDVGLGNEHGCAVTDAEEVYCWGLNDQGQLGRGTISAESGFLPALVTGVPTN